MKRLFCAIFAIGLTGSASAEFFGDYGVSGEIVDLRTSVAMEEITGILTPSNEVQAGLRVTPTINVDNGIDYSLIGVFSGVSVNGFNTARHRDATGVQGTVFKNSANANATGLKCSVYDYLPGGTSTCLRVSYPYPQDGTPTAGIILEGSTWAQGLKGVVVENPDSFESSIDLNGSKIAVGSKDGSKYCLQFNAATAGIDYIKDCGTTAEKVVGKISITPVSTYTKPTR